MNNNRFIVMLIDSTYKEHDGKVFINHRDAYLYALDAIKDNYCDKFVIGMFNHNLNKENLISNVETYGFRNDKKQINQLSLFKNS